MFRNEVLLTTRPSPKTFTENMMAQWLPPLKLPTMVPPPHTQTHTKGAKRGNIMMAVVSCRRGGVKRTKCVVPFRARRRRSAQRQIIHFNTRVRNMISIRERTHNTHNATNITRTAHFVPQHVAGAGVALKYINN